MPRLLLTLFAAVLLAGCVTIYRMDVGQGNIVTPEMASQLKLGMTRSQVRFVLGTPLVTDPFHPDRWDYYYSLLKGTESKPESRRLTVIFKGDALASIEGDISADTSSKP
jgi:outer membrane protein assembly factor BamE